MANACAAWTHAKMMKRQQKVRWLIDIGRFHTYLSESQTISIVTTMAADLVRIAVTRGWLCASISISIRFENMRNILIFRLDLSCRALNLFFLFWIQNGTRMWDSRARTYATDPIHLFIAFRNNSLPNELSITYLTHPFRFFLISCGAYVRYVCPETRRLCPYLPQRNIVRIENYTDPMK